MNDGMDTQGDERFSEICVQSVIVRCADQHLQTDCRAAKSEARAATPEREPRTAGQWNGAFLTIKFIRMMLPLSEKRIKNAAKSALK